MSNTLSSHKALLQKLPNLVIKSFRYFNTFKLRKKSISAVEVDGLLFSLQQDAYDSIWMKTVDTRLQQLGLTLEEILQQGKAETFNTVKCHVTKLDYVRL